MSRRNLNHYYDDPYDEDDDDDGDRVSQLRSKVNILKTVSMID